MVCNHARLPRTWVRFLEMVWTQDQCADEFIKVKLRKEKTPALPSPKQAAERRCQNNVVPSSLLHHSIRHRIQSQPITLLGFSGLFLGESWFPGFSGEFLASRLFWKIPDSDCVRRSQIKIIERRDYYGKITQQPYQECVSVAYNSFLLQFSNSSNRQLMLQRQDHVILLNSLLFFLLISSLRKDPIAEQSGVQQRQIPTSILL